MFAILRKMTIFTRCIDQMWFHWQMAWIWANRLLSCLTVPVPILVPAPPMTVVTLAPSRSLPPCLKGRKGNISQVLVFGCWKLCTWRCIKITFIIITHIRMLIALSSYCYFLLIHTPSIISFWWEMWYHNKMTITKYQQRKGSSWDTGMWLL